MVDRGDGDAVDGIVLVDEPGKGESEPVGPGVQLSPVRSFGESQVLSFFAPMMISPLVWKMWGSSSASKMYNRVGSDPLWTHC